MEWLLVLIAVLWFGACYLNKRDMDEVASDIGSKLAKVSTVTEKVAKSFKAEKEKMQETMKDITEPVNDIKKDIDDIKNTVKGV